MIIYNVECFSPYIRDVGCQIKQQQQQQQQQQNFHAKIIIEFQGILAPIIRVSLLDV